MNAASNQINDKSNFRLKQWAHDARSPILSLEILLTTSESLSETERNLAKLALQRLKRMTQEILPSPHNPVSSEPTSPQTPLPLTQILDRVLSLKWLETSHNPGLTLSLQLGVHAQQAQIAPQHALELERTLSNLLNNAFEAISYSGKVSLSLLYDPSSRAAIIAVEDNGPGIPSTLLPLLRSGRPFLTTKMNGHGLGIFSAHQTLKKLAGSLEIQSEEGHGTTFLLHLPCPSKVSSDII